MAFVINKNMNKLFADFNNIQSTNWGNGVFYASDANSADLRCAYFQSASYDGWDCPGGWFTKDHQWEPDSSKKGAGWYQGKGCHFNHVDSIDQTDAQKDNTGLTRSFECECEYSFKNSNWAGWVDQWINVNGVQKSWGADLAACWMNNPRDMINLQNQLWWKRAEWNDRTLPRVKYDPSSAQANRAYWGWNEVPINRSIALDESTWDAVMIKMPAAFCGEDGKNDFLNCGPTTYQTELEEQLDVWSQQGTYLQKEIVIAREWMDSSGNYFREFFCQDWKSPSGKYNIKYQSNWKCTISSSEDASAGRVNIV